MAQGTLTLPSTRFVKNSNDAGGASWNSSMRNGLDGPLAMDRLRVASDFTLGATVSSAFVTVGTIDEAIVMSEAVAVLNNMSRRVVACVGAGFSKS